jgi:hypothetical protein
MPTTQALYRGAVQAQGNDIQEDGGYTCSWAQDIPVTDQEGLDFLAKIEGQCNDSQKEQRNTAFAKARRFINNAAKDGGVVPEKSSISFSNRDPKPRNARVDIAIASGLTFVLSPSKTIK